MADLKDMTKIILNILIGMGSILCPSVSKPVPPKFREPQDDAIAIAKDFVKVGEDLRRAIESIERENCG